MSDAAEVPDGAAVFPAIPPELGVNPLLLAVIHSVVFINGSDETVVHPTAADEALDFILGYLQRLDGIALERVQEDMDCLVRFARGEKWDVGLVSVLTNFLRACGVGEEGEEEAD
jgi:hypothetical protein